MVHASPERDASFVGRAAELERLLDLLGAGRRLITVTGPPGVGKSRLAAEACAVQERVVTVRRCDLGPCLTVAAAVPVVASAFDVEVGPESGDPTEREGRLSRAIEARGAVLLVLDDAERVVDGVASLARHWLDVCPELTLVVTSRQRLNLSDEVVIEVGPLEPDEARMLLATRLRRVQGATPRTTEASAALADRLDGIPLAIELAAAQASVLGVEEVVARLEEGLSILRSPFRDAPARQSTLEAAIDVSWQLLPGEERRALAALCRFGVPFAWQDAEAVIRPRLEDPAPASQMLVDLRARSWLRARTGPDGEALLELFRSLRDYVERRVDAEPERALIDLGFAEHFLRRAASPGGATRGEDPEAAAATLMRRLEPLLVSADILLHAGRARDAALVMGALDDLIERGVAPEGLLRRLDSVRAALPLDARAERAALAHARACVAKLRGEGDVAVAGFCAAREAAPDDAFELRARIALGLGRARYSMGELDAAEHDLNEALALGRRAGVERWQGEALRALATIHLTSDALDRARDAGERALALHAGAHDRRRAAGARLVLANVSILEGRFRDAQGLLRPALAELEAVRDASGAGHVLAMLGLVAVHEARHDEARVMLDAACRAHRDDGDALQEARALLYRAVLDHDRGALDESDRWLDDVLPVLRQASRRGYALALGHRGLVGLERGALRDARHDLSEASAMLAAMRDIRFATLFDTFRCYAEAGGGLDDARGGWETAAVRAALARGVADPSSPPSVYVRLARRLGAADAERDEAPTPADAVSAAPSLYITRDGRWFRTPGGVVGDLSRRVALHRILRALAEARGSSPGRSLAVDALVEAGWPGERLLPESARGRVYVAIRTLRSMGLEAVLLTSEAGYLIDPRTPVCWTVEERVSS